MKKKVIVYSDYICPFCYIGKNRIDRIKKEFGVEVEWRGLEIHPETPKEGQTLEDMGVNPHYVEMVREHVKRLAKEENLDLKPHTRISNSKMALQLAEFAKENEKFDEYHDEVFKAYWMDVRDIGNPDILFDIIQKIGLDPNEARNFLEGGKAAQKMGEFLSEAKALGIDGVPTFLIGSKIVEGAQPYEVIKRAVNQRIR
ncbi:MAG: DsbA family oxidoreductase [Thermoplasmata archaeon]